MCDRCTALTALGLTRDATQAEIRDAYRTLAKVWHPDRFQDDEQLRGKAEEKIKEINSAYQLLTTTPAGDPKSRPSDSQSEPDQAGETAESDPSASPGNRFPETSRVKPPRRTTRGVSRTSLSIAFLIVFAVGAWLILRNPNAPEVSAPRPANSATSAAASVASGNPPETATRESATAGATNRTNGSAASADKAPPQSRKNAAASEEPSLVVYPADDPRTPYFTVGSTRNDVLRLQGKPSAIENDSFEYGRSTVYFKNGRVQSWHADPDSPLRARMPE
jgi:hypothetical protein